MKGRKGVKVELFYTVGGVRLPERVNRKDNRVNRHWESG